jgi:exonuclease SbcC
LLLTGIALRNIRSYGEEETSIDLRPGLTLFEGDIGSGKSTILTAVEFGLFGLGDLEAKHMLRHGAKKGTVRVSFEVGGRRYAVSRTLAKSGRGIQQEECKLEGEGVSGSYSPSELKPKVLELLGFNEKPDTKSTSRIFRYAVYTPQESMKEVLSMGEGQRLDTLRRAFGIERYSWVVANAEDAVMREWLNRRLDALGEGIAELPRKRTEMGSLEKASGELEEGLETLTKEEAEASLAHGHLVDRIERLEPKKLAVAGLRREIPLIERALKETATRLARLDADERSAEAELKEATEAGTALDSLRPDHDEYTLKRRRLLELESCSEEKVELVNKIQKIKGRIEVERRVLEKEIADLERAVGGAKEASDKIEAIEGRLIALRRRREELSAGLSSLEQAEEELKGQERKAAQLEADKKARDRDIARTEEEWTKIERIGVGAPCPLCRQTLTEVHLRDVHAEYSTRLGSLRAELEPVSLALRSVLQDLEAGMKRRSSLQQMRDEAGHVEVGIGTAENELRDLKKTLSSLEEAAGRLVAKKEALARDGYAPAERGALLEAEAKLDALEPKVVEFNEFKKRIAELETKGVEAEFIHLREIARRKLEVEGRLARLKDEKEEAKKLKAEKEEDLRTKVAQIREEEPFLAQLEEAEEGRRAAETKKDDLGRRLAAARSKREEAEKRRGSLREEIDSLEEKEREMSTLRETKQWLKELFVPSVSAIEKEVLAAINEQFDQHFQQWFSELMEAGDIAVRIDESFSPVVEQDGYEIDAASLSGGERTSLALAYRLALNTMVKLQSSSEGGLLILDEPTDGFSSGQLLRLRDVLQETGCEQIVMVSHEKELESFVDDIFEVSKPSGESVVTKVSR